MNVEKFIRVLGYIVYTALWSPIIVLAILVMPLVYTGTAIRDGRSPVSDLSMFKESLVNSVRHDVEFIQTGKW